MRPAGAARPARGRPPPSALLTLVNEAPLAARSIRHEAVTCQRTLAPALMV